MRERRGVPVLLGKRILKDFNDGHSGMSRMKSLMRSFVYWSGMDHDIEFLEKNCRGCALAEKAPPIKFESWPKTYVPWKRLHIDFAGPLNGSYYFIIVDSFSKWPEIFKCKRPTSTVSVNFLNEIFSRFGVPEMIVFDNGTQFPLSEFAKFCKCYSIEHITTPVYHPVKPASREVYGFV